MLDLVYDANGNLLSGDGYNRTYNSLNQLVAVSNSTTGLLLQEFVYHPLEERILVKRTYDDAGAVIERVVYWDDPFVSVANATGTYNYTYVKHEGQLVGQSLDGAAEFIHGDHLGSTSIVTNQSGDIIEQTEYSPYGEITSGGTVSRFDYESKEFDSLTGHTDFGARFCIPGWGCFFIQPDIIIQDLNDPQMLNRYAFERQNPYTYTDPSGRVVEYGGIKAEVGSGFEVSNMQVFAVAHDPGPSPIRQSGQFVTESKGAMLPPSASLGVVYGIAPFQDNLEEFTGESATFSVDFAVPFSGGISLSIPIETDEETGEENYRFSKFSVSGSLSADLNIFGFSGTMARSNTAIKGGTSIRSHSRSSFVRRQTLKYQGKAYDRLRELSEKNPTARSGDIIKKWRKTKEYKRFKSRGKSSKK